VLVVLCEESLGIREGCSDEIFGNTLVVGSRNDNLNTTQTLEYTKDRYNVNIRNARVSPKGPTNNLHRPKDEIKKKRKRLNR
jgi:hypothetical protein